MANIFQKLKNIKANFRAKKGTAQNAKTFREENPEYFIKKYWKSPHSYPNEIEYYDDFRSFILEQPWFRDNKQKGMFSSPSHFNNYHMETRYDHLLRAEGIAKRVAKGMGLNSDLASLCALLHDDHISHGHEGERQATRYASDKLIGYITHNGLGALNFLYKNDIPKHFRELLQTKYNLTEQEALKNTEWLPKLAESSLKHDGESTGTTYDYDSTVSDDDLREHVVNIFTVNNYSKKAPGEKENPANGRLIASAKEVALVKNVDKMAYVVSDYLDGRKMGKIPDKQNIKKYSEYIEIFKQMGLLDEYTLRSADKYKVATALLTVLERDLIENSRATSTVQFSDKIGLLLNKLIEVNYKQVSSGGLSEDDARIYPEAKGKLIHSLATTPTIRVAIDRVLNGDYLSREETRDNNITLRKALRFINKLPKGYLEMAQDIVNRSLVDQLEREIKLAIRLNNGEVLEGKKLEDEPNKDKKEEIIMFNDYKNHRLRVKKMQAELFRQYGNNPTEAQQKAYLETLIAESEISSEEFDKRNNITQRKKQIREQIKLDIIAEYREALLKSPTTKTPKELKSEIKEKIDKTFDDIVCNNPDFVKIETSRERLYYWICQQRVLQLPDSLLINVLHENGIINDSEKQKLESLYGSAEFEVPSKERQAASNLSHVQAERKQELDEDRECR